MDRRSGSTRQLTADLAPTRSPAVSADGRGFAFASGKSGWASIWRVAEGAAPEQVTHRDLTVEPGTVPTLEPFPEAISAPLLHDGWLVFEARGAVHVTRMDGRATESIPGAAVPHWREPGRRLGVLMGTPQRVYELALGEVKP